MPDAIRPRVVTHNVSSLDGRVGLAGVVSLHGDERWSAMLDEPTDMWALHDPQVMLEGSNSFVAAEAIPPPLPAVPANINVHEDFVPSHIVTADRSFYAVVDSRGRVRWTQKLGDHDEHLMILASLATPPSYLNYLREEDIPYLVVGKERVDLAAALERLATRLSVHTVVASGGGLLNGALLAAGLVDEVDIDFAPAIIGGRGAPLLFDGPPLQANEWPTRLSVISMEQKAHGGFFVRYAVTTAT